LDSVSPESRQRSRWIVLTQSKSRLAHSRPESRQRRSWSTNFPLSIVADQLTSEPIDKLKFVGLKKENAQ